MPRVSYDCQKRILSLGDMRLKGYRVRQLITDDINSRMHSSSFCLRTHAAFQSQLGGRMPITGEEAIKGAIDSLPSGVLFNSDRCASFDAVSARRLTLVFFSAQFYSQALHTANLELLSRSFDKCLEYADSTFPLQSPAWKQRGTTSPCRGEPIRTIRASVMQRC